MRLKDVRVRFYPVNKMQYEGRLTDNQRPKIFFIFVVLFYIFYQLLMQPSWVLGGGMWAEMATNYYPNANASSFVQKLLSTDAGYIPAPQRLIALVGNQLNLPAATIPYFYTWSSIFFTGILVGVFCLPQFRKLVRSDYLRFFTSIAVLLVADFETRTFINFTYFGAFFVAIITALALVEDSEEIPWWAGITPILMVSKPAVLAAMPAMILVAFVSRPRFRLIVLLAVVLCLGQFLQMFISSTAGTMPFRNGDITFVSKLLTVVKYFFGFFGGYITGPYLQFQQFYLIICGILIFFVCFFLFQFKRSSSNALIVVGISILFFNVLLNTFALSDSWNLDMARLHGIPVHRHIIVGFFGCVLVMCGVVCSVTNNNSFKSRSRFIDGFGAFLFVLWFLGVGWLAFAGKVSREPGSPTINNSQWQILAEAIDSGQSPLCVPIDPWWKVANWMYHRNCGLLEPPPAWEDGRVRINDNFTHQIDIPASLIDKTLVSAAILVKPLGSGKSFVEVQMRIKLKDGNIRYLSGSRDFYASGGLLMLVGGEPIPINDISAITLIFNVPVEVALTPEEPAGVPGVAWMGH
ncbi:hypothetical protein I6H96_08950 [Brucella anthropi]|uniref:Uncharacterized protein n=1 Tax=Brucella anthropi (strain ATCC 49188 / DSM 6882 / CCUG 24695 / JCM 21032 / LMG 3331 / NBRC 15819 / NCTC 12168 / Alc 37) TaxID=439375 RepID=A6WWT2_BRUA4|nr:hypothetical protein [Brucella anthropi]ABS13436.1 hypothetical protein Oant_0713 [Brucella anthropi ATCC 49188]QQC24354.1 hypothetical protein I6H96_08950 [Brucella anthropi]SUA61312.1 Uncharacterised protein [Brucella anthropi]